MTDKQAFYNALLSMSLLALFVGIWCCVALFTSCATTSVVDSQGKTTIITTDTTVVNHSGKVTVKVK